LLECRRNDSRISSFLGQEGVEIVAGPASRKGEPARINIIRYLLKGVICLPNDFHAAVIPIDSMVLPDPPRRAKLKFWENPYVSAAKEVLKIEIFSGSAFLIQRIFLLIFVLAMCLLAHTFKPVH